MDRDNKQIEELDLLKILGWKENTEYRVHRRKFKVVEDVLYQCAWNYKTQDYYEDFVKSHVTLNAYKHLRGAEKVPEK